MGGFIFLVCTYSAEVWKEESFEVQRIKSLFVMEMSFQGPELGKQSWLGMSRVGH